MTVTMHLPGTLMMTRNPYSLTNGEILNNCNDNEYDDSGDEKWDAKQTSQQDHCV